MQLNKSFTIGAIVVLSTGVFPCSIAAQRPETTTKPTAQERRPGAAVTDAWVTMKIHSQFVPEEALEDSNIDVDTNNGVVTLNGTVASAAGRTRAVAIAKATEGVKSVNDALKVAPPTEGAAAREAARETKGAAKAGGRRVTDGWIKSKIYADFLTENALEDSDINVDVRGGNVTLTGTVPTETGRARATAVAKATDGVKNVKDSLKVAKR